MGFASRPSAPRATRQVPSRNPIASDGDVFSHGSTRRAGAPAIPSAQVTLEGAVDEV